MKEIHAEGTNFIYFKREDELPNDAFWGLQIAEANYAIGDTLRTVLPLAEDFRFILVREKRPNNESLLVPHLLYWVENKDLNELDNRVEAESHTDEDFKSAVKVYLHTTYCTNCGWHGLTLVFGYASVYLDSPKLHHQKEKLALEHWLSCPQCDTPFRINVVKIF